MCTSKPKIPAPTPVIERQAYKSAPSRESLSSGNDPNARRRALAGVETSARGVLEPASTTRRVRAGGDQDILPVFGSAPSTPATEALAAVAPISRGAQSANAATGALLPWGARAAAAQAKFKPTLGSFIRSAR